MGERKVLNKYIPADFDPSLIPRGKKLSAKDGTVPVRMMLPFSIQCSTCHTFLYRGRKFNSKKEPMGGPNGRYLDIQRFRFYIKCNHCSRPITFLTDPKNADYEMESGGTRNYEVYKDKREKEEEAALEKEQDEKDDSMKKLENRVLDSQREMADQDNLEEIKAMNRRHISLLNATGSAFDDGAKALLDTIQERKKDDSKPAKIQLTEEDEALVKSIKFGQQTQLSIRRLNEDDEKSFEARRLEEVERMEKRQQELSTKPSSLQTLAPIRIVKRKRPSVQEAPNKKPTSSLPQPPSNGLNQLLGDYGSDSDSD